MASYLGKEAPNYFLYQNEKGQFSPIIWNLNFIIGTYKNLGRGSDLSVEQLIELDPFLHIDNQLKPLVSKLLNNTKNQKLYRSHLRTLIYDEILSGQFEARARALQEQIKVAFTNDPNRYYDTAAFDKSLVAVIGKVSKVPGIVTFMNERARFLKKHPELIYIPSEVSNITYTQRARFSSKRVQKYQIQATVSSFTNKVEIFYRFAEDGSFQQATMEDNGKHNDGESGDNIYGITIRPEGDSGKIQYYIRAENPKTFGYLPAKYMHEYQEISLAELNK
ncbi:MAG: CotH kinase family protein [Bacteroidota bacterium]